MRSDCAPTTPFGRLPYEKGLLTQKTTCRVAPGANCLFSCARAPRLRGLHLSTHSSGLAGAHHRPASFSPNPATSSGSEWARRPRTDSDFLLPAQGDLAHLTVPVGGLRGQDILLSQAAEPFHTPTTASSRMDHDLSQAILGCSDCYW